MPATASAGLDRMPVFDHLGVSVDDLARGIAQFHPVLHALGIERHDAEGSVSWQRDDET
ncbi:hypothetical protein CLV46_1086 [Diaminobutyricimonas aerilata]|uniref:Glyoxalase/bleomycin resistance protein/dioxygenase superfamily protein n=1 Tax=Diaminobutyricimonas aerilata TaxID=1162967 RepID=A0A2M9CI22_9MICO|nr:hypothetical protein [Diaminobutyricimonas aerilata]PJJ71537.1 hypothetical protein CLV46_1086 [Diaminobutyricimonas aerilata]